LELARKYLNRRSNELQHGGFKSVRFSVGLFVSVYGARPIGAVSRDLLIARAGRATKHSQEL
jgi:hypothetical protein